MDEETIFKVTFVHDGCWKEDKSSNGLKYVEGRLFTEKLDADADKISSRKNVAPAPSISHATISYLDFEGVDMQDFQEETECEDDEIHVVDDLFGRREERLLLESEENEPKTDKELEDIVLIIHRTLEFGASKLKNEIQNKYNLTLPYSRVLKARGKAIELVY
ncbi:hypothetical protein QJS10_CPB12g00597 [Acorus calamus]|uniref:Uncharacterized protein n=1 Tax=Acorus calamus TaxID=4465 RepID=A0AAV9DLC3_ACOCL|nr:hypothetical protein QJS10_CPB12g00597 [Acorus calamus]